MEIHFIFCVIFSPYHDRACSALSRQSQSLSAPYRTLIKKYFTFDMTYLIGCQTPQRQQS